MAPIRRYLRISKYSVLECRIYLDNPSDARWLLNPRDPMLPRIFTAIQPLVLPKLREENERLWSRKKGKPVKDVIAEDEFEVAIFLRESRTRHAVLTRNKTFHEPGNKKNKPLKAEPGEGARDDLVDPAQSTGAQVILDSDDSEAEVDLSNIPEATKEGHSAEAALLLDADKTVRAEEDPAKDEKKMRFSTHYESFNITGWILCLLVTRKGERPQSRTNTSPMKQPLMEEWISSQAQTGLSED